MKKRATWAALAVLIGGSAHATVLTLHDEATQGDLNGTQSFTLQAGSSEVRGSTSLFWAPNAPSASDNDQFSFRVGAGLTLVGIEMAYNVSATRGNAASTIRQHYDRGDGSLVAEEIPGGAAYAGVVSLFDTGGFHEISGDDGFLGRMLLHFSSAGFNLSLPGEHGATSWANQYTLTFLVEPTAAAVPLPGTLALGGLGLAAMAGVSTRRRKDSGGAPPPGWRLTPPCAGSGR